MGLQEKGSIFLQLGGKYIVNHINDIGIIIDAIWVFQI